VLSRLTFKGRRGNSTPSHEYNYSYFPHSSSVSDLHLFNPDPDPA
jgi:hypothetical protein